MARFEGTIPEGTVLLEGRAFGSREVSGHGLGAATPQGSNSGERDMGPDDGERLKWWREGGRRWFGDWERDGDTLPLCDFSLLVSMANIDVTLVEH